MSSTGPNKSKRPGGNANGGGVSRFVKFETRTVRRSDIKLPDYNPRRMSKEARRRLERSIAEDGLVEPLVWNVRTGNLVGGRHRLEILDEKEGGQDYEVVVAAIDVDEARERKINVKLNNPSMQGEFDEDKLQELLSAFPVLEWEEFGFSPMEIEVLAGLDTSEFLASLAEVPERNADADELKKVKSVREGMKESLPDKQSADFFTVLVFESVEQRDAFHAACKLPVADVYVKGSEVMRYIGASGDDGGTG